MNESLSSGEDPSIFISYNRADLVEAMAVDEALKAQGLRTFIDKERVGGAADFEFTIYDAIQSEVTHVVVVLTENAARSRWVRFEVLVAERSGKRVILYRRPEWRVPAYWERWLSSQVHDLAEILASVRRESAPAKASSIRWNLTTYPTPEFVDRNSEVEEIARRLDQDPVPLVLTGLGGMGKTQLALEHIFRRHEDYDIIWWVRASERAVLLTDLAALGLELQLPSVDLENLQKTAESVVQWLTARERYLLVFDSASRPEDVAPFVPEGRGHRLLTSRRSDWPWGPALIVSKFDADYAVEFLMRRTQLPRSPDMEKVAKHLDGLPLALAQAGAYVIQKQISFAEYFDRLTRNKSRLMEAGALIESDARVASTWDLSFTEALAESPEARSVIAISSFLAAEGIPRELVELKALDGDAGNSGQPTSALTGDATAALRTLSRYSLITLMPRTFSIHGLVQDMVRERMEDGSRWLQSALERLNTSLPPPSSNEVPKRFEELSPHVLAATRHSAIRGANIRLSMALLLDVGDFMTRRSLLIDARGSLELALRMGEEKFGEDSTVLTSVLNSLGLTCDFIGDFPAAESAYNRGLKIAETSASQAQLADLLRSNLGALYHNMNKPERARDLLEPLAAQPDTRGIFESIASRQKLGQAHMAEGKLELAEKEFMEVLKLRDSGLIQEEAELAQSYGDLGQLYSHRKDWAKALDFFDRAVELYRKEIEDDHLFLAITLYNRSSVYEAMKRPVDALNDLEAARAIVIKRAGKTHPYLAVILFNMARLVIGLRKPHMEAEELLRGVIDACRAHPEMQNLTLIELQASMLLQTLRDPRARGAPPT
jgi:tetratricopeptide (TPR) repeat protein